MGIRFFRCIIPNMQDKRETYPPPTSEDWNRLPLSAKNPDSGHRVLFHLASPISLRLAESTGHRCPRLIIALVLGLPVPCFGLDSPSWRM